MQDALHRELDKRGVITVVEPPSGLTDQERQAVEQAIRLEADGRHAEAEAVLAPFHMRFEPQVVQQGKLVGLDGPTCADCGGLTQRTGTCYTCVECGTTGGCG